MRAVPFAVFTIIVFTVLLIPASAEISKSIAVYGVLKNATTGVPLTGTYSTTFGIYNVNEGGTALAEITQDVIAASGLFTTLLNLSTLKFDENYWLQIQVGDDVPLTPRQQLTPTPYALGMPGITSVDGNIGIGTTDPLYKLDVNGGVRITEVGVPLTFDMTGGLWRFAQGPVVAGNPLQIQSVATGSTDPVTVMNLARNGNVGIGTTDPQFKLDVVDDQGTNPFVLSAYGAAGSVVQLGSGASQGHTDVRLQRANRDYNDMLSFVSRIGGTGGYTGIWNIGLQGGIDSDDLFITGNQDEKVIIKAGTGNVGIGTTSPTETLSVNGSVVINGSQMGPATHLLIDDGLGRGSGVLFANSGVLKAGIGYTPSVDRLEINADAGTMALRTDGNITFGGLTTERLRVASNGNVGIGTANPSTKLDVLGEIQARSSDASYGILKIRPAGSNNSVIEHISDTGDLYIRVRESGETSGNMILNDYGGNVGIGTTSPTSTLYVNGNTTFRSPVSGQTVKLYEVNETSYNVTYLSLITPQQRGILVKDRTTIEGGLWVYGGGTASSGGIGSGVFGDLGTMRATATAGGSYIGFVDGTIRFYARTSTTIGAVGFNERMRIKGDTGYVGIGKSSPTQALDVDIPDAYVNVTEWPSIQTDTCNANNTNTYGCGVGEIKATCIDAYVNASGNNFTRNVTCNVSNIALSGSIILNAANAPLVTRGFDAFSSGAYAGLGRWGLFMEPSALTAGFPNSGGKSFRISTYNADSTRIDLVAVDSSGRVGIGTMSPANKLHVNGTSPVRIIADTTGQYAVFNLYENGTERGALYLDTTNDIVITEAATAHKLGFNVNGATRAITIDTAGNVGIGTTSPTQKLDVNGNVSVNGNIAFAAIPGGTRYITTAVGAVSDNLVIGVGSSGIARNLTLYAGTATSSGTGGNVVISGGTGPAGSGNVILANDGLGGLVKLPTYDFAPVTCNANYVGYMYVDTLTPLPTPFAASFLCICVKYDVVIWKWMRSNGASACD